MAHGDVAVFDLRGAVALEGLRVAVLDHLLSYRNRFACTSSELVKTIHALSEFEER